MLRESNEQKEHGSQKEALPRGTAFGLMRFHDLAYLGTPVVPFCLFFLGGGVPYSN